MVPQQQSAGTWLHPDLAAMAAAYLFHIACNHPFIDGNKRAAALVRLPGPLQGDRRRQIPAGRTSPGA
jgi:hypothetical protein